MKKLTVTIILVSFLLNSIWPGYAQTVSMGGDVLPDPGTMILVSQAFAPVSLEGIRVVPEDPRSFDFIIDTGDQTLAEADLKKEAEKLIRYFMASMTIPDNELWVNLSPYEKDRIIPEALGRTEMGRDMLAEDYLLKQLTASLMHPDHETGKELWQRIYAKAYEKFGTIDIPVDTFNKVWILPDVAEVYEDGGKAFIVESRLKVMLETDYEAMFHQRDIAESFASAKDVAANQRAERDGGGVPNPVSSAEASTQELTKQIIREVVIPQLEAEVNNGKNFAQLRQIYRALILAYWFKNNLKGAALNRVYADQGKIRGVDVAEQGITQKIYDLYFAAFRTGVFNFIKDERDPQSHEEIPRKYMAGGVQFGGALSQSFRIGSEDKLLRLKDKSSRRVIGRVRMDNVADSSEIVASGNKLPKGDDFHRKSYALDVLRFFKNYVSIVSGLKLTKWGPAILPSDEEINKDFDQRKREADSKNINEHRIMSTVQLRIAQRFPISKLNRGQNWLLQFKLDIVRHKKKVNDALGLPTSPVVILKFKDNDYYLVDGHHRVVVAMENGETSIPAYIIDFSFAVDSGNLFPDMMNFYYGYKNNMSYKNMKEMGFDIQSGKNGDELYTYYGHSLILVEDSLEITTEILEAVKELKEERFIKDFLESLGKACFRLKEWDHGTVVRAALNELSWPEPIFVSRESFLGLKVEFGSNSGGPDELRAKNIVIQPADNAAVASSQARPGVIETEDGSFDFSQFIAAEEGTSDALNKGGIDLNAQNMNVHTTGAGASWAMPEGMDMENIQGLTPVIISLTPVADMDGLIGKGKP